MGSKQLILRAAALVGVAASLAACGTTSGGVVSPADGRRAAPYRPANLKPYEIGGRVYRPRVDKDYDERGLASWYSYPAGTRRTATGEPFDPGRLTAAHKTLPLPCVVEVTNLANGKKVRVRVNDRGPFVDGRIIDLSRAAADRIGMTGQGVAQVRVKFLGRAIADSGEIMLAQAAADEAGEGVAALF